ncbi:C2 domain protein [Raphanus sativus]|nr:C2 domain protein [Raphanus sativus]
MNCLNPRFHEQYTWEVYEPATVITIGVFNNNGPMVVTTKMGRLGKPEFEYLLLNQEDSTLTRTRFSFFDLQVSRTWVNYIWRFGLLAPHVSDASPLLETDSSQNALRETFKSSAAANSQAARG